jgi:hypothetical protein
MITDWVALETYFGARVWLAVPAAAGTVIVNRANVCAGNVLAPGTTGFVDMACEPPHAASSIANNQIVRRMKRAVIGPVRSMSRP